MDNKRIYFVGAHRTGKTTAARWVSREYGKPLINEVARSVLTEMEKDLEPLRTDLRLASEYQKEIFQRQIKIEKELTQGFVSDRAFDNLAYAAEFTEDALPQMMETKQFEDYMEWVKQGVIFFTRPHPSLLVKDSVNQKLDWEQVVRIDGMIKFMMKQFRVKYLPIHPVDFEERVQIMRFALDNTDKRP